MDIQEKLQYWKNEVERAEQYGFYFDTQSMREVINTVEEQQKKINDLKQNVMISVDAHKDEIERRRKAEKEIKRITEIIELNNLPLHPCGVCGKEERNPGLEVCGECYHKQIWDND